MNETETGNAMLDYENQLFLDIIHENELFVFAKGVLTELVLKNVFEAYTTETSLVFVLGASKGEEAYFREKLNNEKVYTITSEEYLSNTRKVMYGNGGLFFITARILVMDLLKEIFPIDKVTGIILLKAHNIAENSQEAFILRLYRTKNKEGFIKAFSQTPTSFLLGFAKLNRVMRSSFLANVSLWPRFHAVVKQSLNLPGDDSLTHVVEIQLNLTEEMREIQTNLLDLVSWSVSELKRLVPALNDDEINAETALTHGFQKIIGAHMDAEWNTINNKAKELLNDLKVFRILLTYLTKFDCVSFYSALCNYTSSDMVFKSSWIVSTSAEKVIVASRGRILKQPKKTPNEQASGAGSKKATFKPEVHPKWLAVSEILNDTFKQSEKRVAEIATEEMSDDDSSCGLAMKSPDLKTLIFVEDSRTCSVLKDYLTDGSLEVMGKLVHNSDKIKIDLPPDLIAKLNSKRKADSEPSAKRIKISNNKDNSEGVSEAGPSNDGCSKDKDVQITLTQIRRKYETVEVFPSPVMIRPYNNPNEEDAFSVNETLLSLKPDVIVIFDPELELVRQIEIHRARMAPQQNIRVYFLVFRNSVEEQIYLTSIQREKLAFEKLIEEKASMVVPNEREAKDELNQDLWRDPSKASDAIISAQSHRNMEQTTEGREIILVDIREFRSELPSLLHKRGIDLEPLTLDVGDYILTPDICVERKSISDLIGSLNCGRLYKQAEAMGRHYKKPILLIEHEQKAQLSTRFGKNDLTQVMPKLQVLTMNFPNLRLIWSPGSHYTSEVFQELKKGKDQPSPEEAMAIQKESVGEHISTKYNPIPHSFLSKMPGIDSRNVYSILNRCESLHELANLTEKDLEETLENSHTAAVLYAGLHSETLTSDAQAATSSKLKSVKALMSKQKKPFFRVRVLKNRLSFTPNHNLRH
ncbi:unnamed protein product [Allacma fusca]|uniref:DNA repair endonuclease XPF n=1 Tax=Allacma fusca TaxID=39272 RepID=A0A8J2JWG5_9HEXA|nr:unnamed protein product [Allacma fusca]